MCELQVKWTRKEARGWGGGGKDKKIYNMKDVKDCREKDTTGRKGWNLDIKQIFSCFLFEYLLGTKLYSP